MEKQIVAAIDVNGHLYGEFIAKSTKSIDIVEKRLRMTLEPETMEKVKPFLFPELAMKTDSRSIANNLSGAIEVSETYNLFQIKKQLTAWILFSQGTFNPDDSFFGLTVEYGHKRGVANELLLKAIYIRCQALGLDIHDLCMDIKKDWESREAGETKQLVVIEFQGDGNLEEHEYNTPEEVAAFREGLEALDETEYHHKVIYSGPKADYIEAGE